MLRDFVAFLRQSVAGAVLFGGAAGLLVTVLFVLTGGMAAKVDVDIAFARFDGLWFLVGLPVLLALVAVVMAPLAYGLQRLARRSMPRERER